ncbi:MAG: HAMP domain-containing protein [Anaerolineales bacterium]|nr:HAMP domain-containing protein [Anaerolineales bacterium]
MEDNGSQRSLIRLLLSIPLRYKITIPYLVVAALVAGLATYQVSRSFATNLEARFRSQLADVSARVADSVVELEDAHLQNVRTIAFTLGVSEAVAQRDAGMISELVYPQIINNQIQAADILDASGGLLASWHQLEATNRARPEAASYPDWPIVKQVLSRQSDPLGDRYSDLVDTPWGLILYTAGPILENNELVGVVLIGTHISKWLPQVALRSIANLSLYDSSGEAVFSTLGSALPASLPAEQLSRLAATGATVPTRTVTVASRDYVEVGEKLYLRGQASGWFLGIALPADFVQQAGGSNLVQLVVIFVFFILALIGLGVAMAEVIAMPITRLLHASEQVGAGNLDVHLDAFSDDEIGSLTRSFNQMIADLRQRDFMREMFGRMVSEDVSEAVLNGKLALGGETRYVSVLFTDVRGFTSISEKYSPGEVIQLLNQFFAIITQATRRYQGVINHFGGDSVLAVFGAPIERSLEQSLSQAILAALEIRQGIIEMNAQRIRDGQIPLRFGVGINSGSVIAGNIGTEDRFQYTVIGDVVNVAARLQGISRQFPRTPLLLPASSIEILRDHSTIEFQYLGEFRLRGRERPVPTYAIVGHVASIPPGFGLFDGFPYPRHEALLACYLYGRGFEAEVIAEALQLGLPTVQRWLVIARENAKVLIPVLTKAYGLESEAFDRLVLEPDQEMETL